MAGPEISITYLREIIRIKIKAMFSVDRPVSGNLIG